MAQELYERYKDALRTGHVAVLRGRLAEALAAYRDAAAIAPERALPHASLGGVLLRLGHVDEALFEYDAAVERAPRDEGALLGRAEAMLAAERRAEAAADLDVVAEIQAASGRLPEACDTLQRAVELDPTEPRRERQQALLREVQSESPEPAADEGLNRALRTLEPLAEGGASPAAEPPGEEGGERAEGAGGAAGADAVLEQYDAATSIDLEATGAIGPAGPGEGESQPSGVAGPGSGGAEPASMAAASDADGVPVELVAPDLETMAARADEALDRGDREAARSALIALARARGEAGLFDAALDSAHRALAVAPGDPKLHLVLVDLFISRGWRDLAGDKLALLGRLAELSDDAATRQEIGQIVAESFGDDPRLQTYRP